MNKYNLIYGSLGLLSILGILGILTKDWEFLCFFAFAVHLQYFFVDIDEMLIEYMNKSATFAFYADSLFFIIIGLWKIFVLNDGISKSLIFAKTLSWSVSIFIYTISIVIYELRERIGMKND